MPALPGACPLRGRVNYILGNDPRNGSSASRRMQSWFTGISTPGIRCCLLRPRPIGRVNFCRQSRCAPGDCPGEMRRRGVGLGRPRRQPGTAVSRRPVTQSRPRAFQVAEGKEREVAACFRTDHLSYGFAVTGPYDPALPLYIDPILAFSSYLGGAARTRHTPSPPIRTARSTSPATRFFQLSAQSAFQPYAQGAETLLSRRSRPTALRSFTRLPRRKFAGLASASRSTPPARLTSPGRRSPPTSRWPLRSATSIPDGRRVCNQAVPSGDAGLFNLPRRHGLRHRDRDHGRLQAAMLT